MGSPGLSAQTPTPIPQKHSCELHQTFFPDWRRWGQILGPSTNIYLHKTLSEPGTAMAREEFCEQADAGWFVKWQAPFSLRPSLWASGTFFLSKQTPIPAYLFVSFVFVLFCIFTLINIVISPHSFYLSLYSCKLFLMKHWSVSSRHMTLPTKYLLTQLEFV